jgi:lipopolysaccharide export system permease protein
MAVLPATLMSFGNLASENEITAMKSSGISLYRLIVPGLVAATLLTVGLVYYNSHVLPETNHRLMNLVIDITRKKPTVELQPNETIKAIQGYSIYFREKNDRTGEIKDVQIVKHASRGVYPTMINAASGKLKFIEAENVLRFDLVDGEIHELPVRSDLSTYRHTKFKQYTINIKDVDRSLQRSERKHRGDREMSVKMMKEKIDDIRADIDLSKAKIVKSANARMNNTFELLNADVRAERFGTTVDGDSAAGAAQEEDGSRQRFTARTSGGSPGDESKEARNEYITRQEIETQVGTNKSYLRQINRYHVEIQKKYSIPFACIIFVLIGSPIAIRTGKSGMNMAIGLSILFFLVYYICLIGGEKLADRGFLSPVFAMWSPNILFGALAVLLLWNAARERTVTEWNFAILLKPFRRNAATNSR